MIFKATLPILAAIACTACTSSSSEYPYGTSDPEHLGALESMMREDFLLAMEANLQDFDTRYVQLQQRANELGGEPLEEFADYSDDLQSARDDFRNQLQKAESAMSEDWEDQREETIAEYREMRELLDNAYENILES